MIQSHRFVARLLALSALFLGTAACDTAGLDNTSGTTPGGQEWAFAGSAPESDYAMQDYPEWGPTSPSETVTGAEITMPSEPPKTAPVVTPEMAATLANIANNLPLDVVVEAIGSEHTKIALPVAASCGDGVCNRGEDGISCVADCDGESGILCATNANDYDAASKLHYASDSYFDCDGVCRKENVWPHAYCERAYNCAAFNHDDGNCTS